ncbi:hypothetical protein [Psychromonas aquatilis]|uniref:Uncharacterized protein n=1 Tax=Psychromonas aquatilis TaxID=2005072 RepID=A0ABU9GMB5_9GAMM
MKITGWAVIAMYTLATANAGFLIGCTSFGDYFVGVKWTDVVSALGTIIGGFAAAFAAYHAYKTLNTWKEQFAHSQRYEAIVTLEKAYYKLLQDFEVYSQSTLWDSRIKRGTIAHSDLQKLAGDIELHKRNWERALSHSTSSLEWASSFCKDEEASSIDGIIELTELIMRQQISSIEAQERSSTNRVIALSVALEGSINTVSM